MKRAWRIVLIVALVGAIIGGAVNYHLSERQESSKECLNLAIATFGYGYDCSEAYINKEDCFQSLMGLLYGDVNEKPTDTTPVPRYTNRD